ARRLARQLLLLPADVDARRRRPARRGRDQHAAGHDAALRRAAQAGASAGFHGAQAGPTGSVSGAGPSTRRLIGEAITMMTSSTTSAPIVAGGPPHAPPPPPPADHTPLRR